MENHVFPSVGFRGGFAEVSDLFTLSYGGGDGRRPKPPKSLKVSQVKNAVSMASIAPSFATAMSQIPNHKCQQYFSSDLTC